jgi:quinol monooxygenase YgiN
MANRDTCCTLVPYFQVHAGQLAAFKDCVRRFIALSETEPKCLHYAFSFSGDAAHCREGYTDAEGLLAHLDNVGAVLQEALKIADVTRVEVHGPAAELAKLQEPLKGLSPQYFELFEGGFRR